MMRMIDCDAALATVQEHAAPRAAIEVELDEALGLVLDETVRCDRDYPPFTRAMMDGYAVRQADAGRTLPVVGEVAAGNPLPPPLPADACVEIMTGAPCPEGTELVVPKEEVQQVGTQIAFPAQLERGAHLVPRGREAAAGAQLLAPGAALTASTVAALAAVGKHRVTVHRRPRLAIISTGKELVSMAQPVGPTQIRDSNGPMLCAMARSLGLSDLHRARATDATESLLGALGAAAGCDIIVLSGGVSAGRYDLVPAALEAFGATPIFHKVAQKPGKPILFARKEQQLLFGLPGTPQGSHLGFHRYVRAAVRCMMGHRPGEPAEIPGRLTAPLRSAGERVKFILCRASASRDGWLVAPSPSSSSDLFAPCSANAYVRLPAGAQVLAPGANIAFEWAVGAQEAFA